MTNVRAVQAADAPPAIRRVAIVGNPNVGKTTLFNRISGLRHKTANFPGTTQEARIAQVSVARAAATDDWDDESRTLEIIDLPGAYSLELDVPESAVCRDLLRGGSAPAGHEARAPEAVCVVVDATNLARGLLLVAEVLRLGRPVVLAVNMIDIARRRGLRIDSDGLADRLGCEVVCVCGRTGEGVDRLLRVLASPAVASPSVVPGEQARAWAGVVADACTEGVPRHDTMTERIDRVVTHPVWGLLIFAVVMGALFWTVFKLATYPMDWIDLAFTSLAEGVRGLLPPGAIEDFLASGVVSGVGATVIFLPQICILFFLISLLEDSGYLARAALLMDRVMRPFGLPGHAFVPLLSSHACALPGIIACRSIPDRRERLAAILVAPFMSCTARIPVYVLLTSLLFRQSASLAALAFAGCYMLGMAAGLFSAWVARRTILRGSSRPMAIELPTYKLPGLRSALLTTWDRGLVFLRKAGTVILAISMILWWLSSYPQSDPPPAAVELRQQALVHPERAAELTSEASRIEARHGAANSFAGMIGRGVQPAFEPLGYDWKLTIGVLTSFAAREVFVSTMAVIVSGDEELQGESLVETVGAGKRDDGRPIFTTATSWSLLIYYVLAMQCLPTLAVTARESGGVKWAFVQLGWMQGLAYGCAAIAYWSLRAAGVA